MKARNQTFWIITAAVTLGAAYVTWAAIRAHRDLVTLNVRNMEVKKVIGKLEWQTRETILADKNVTGNVTLNVRKVPLEEVLRIVGEQTSSRLSTLYPLYSSSKAMSQLQRALRGEVDPGIAGWTNLQGRGFGGGPFGGPGGPAGFGGPGGRGGPLFGDSRTNRSSVVSMDIQGKDVQFAATALSRFAGARVVPDDKLHTTVNLRLDQVPVEDAVARLAKKARAKWDKLYVLRGDDGLRQFAERRGELTDAEREEMRKRREAMEKELLETLSPEERARREQARLEREKMLQELQTMTPEQRRERFEQFGSAMREQRNLDRIKNTTPEQRVDRYREMNERRKRWQERQAGGDSRPAPDGPRRFGP